MRPPDLPRRLLERLLPPADRQAVIGDLDEEFRRHVAPARGARSAALWYWRQALLSIPAALRLRSRARGARRGRARERRARQAIGSAAMDVRYAVRLARRDAGFTAAAMTTHALAVAVTTAVVTLAYIVLLRPLPYASPDRLVHLGETEAARPDTMRNFSYPDFVAIRSHARVFERVAGYSGGSRTLSGAGSAERIPMTEVTDRFFETLGVSPLLGRTFDARDVERGAADVAILSHGSWLARFGGRSDILDEAILLNGAPHRVIGVMPRDFEFALRGTTEVWLPLRPSQAQLERRYFHWLDVLARVRAGATAGEVRDDMAALDREAAESDPRWHADRRIAVAPLRDRVVGNVRTPLVALLAAVGLVLLGSCSSLAGLHVARWSVRAQEVGVRAAIGASRARLRRQFLLESLLLGVCASALGLVAGSWLLKIFVASLPVQHRTALPHHDALSLDVATAAIVVLLSLLTVVIAGFVPAVRAARIDPAALLRAGRSSPAAGAGRTRFVLVAAQVALAAMLMAGAALLGRSTWQVLHVSAGFDTERLLTMRINLPDQGYSSAPAVREFHARLLERLEAVPGVASAATINQLPLTGRGNTGTFVFDAEPAGGDERRAAIRAVSLEYFEVMGVPLLEGRPLSSADRPASPPVVLVNETFARRFSGGAGVLGRRIVFEFFSGRPRWEIVGIVGDERFEALDRSPMPVVYFPFAQDSGGAFSVVMRTAGDPVEPAAAARAAVGELDAGLPAFLVRSMEQIVAESDAVFLRRQVLVLLVVFGIAALIVSATGVYAVLAHLVAQQRTEIGVRLALGAGGGDIASMVLARGVGPAMAGLAVGLALAAAAARGLEALLFEVSPADPLSLLAVAATLLAAVLAACLVPTLRALRVDPAVALRHG